MNSAQLHLRSAIEIPQELGADQVYESAWRFMVRKPFAEVEYYRSREGELCSACASAGELVVIHADGSGLARPITKDELRQYTPFPDNPTVYRDATRILGIFVFCGFEGSVELPDGSSQEFAAGDLIVCGVKDELSVLRAELINPESPQCAYRRIK